jgi:hypothetical protein
MIGLHVGSASNDTRRVASLAASKKDDISVVRFYALQHAFSVPSLWQSLEPVTKNGSLGSKASPSRIVAFAVLAAIPVKLLARRLEDPDLWWHLKTGALIVRNHSIPAVDPFSYTAAGKHWVVQEWGSEVILYGIHKWFGLYGILFYRGLLVLLIYLLFARLLVKRMGSGMGTWALLALSAFAGSVNWTERPNLLSFLLFVLTLMLLERRDKAIWWFIPLAAVWSNLHGMVVLGIGLVALIAVTEWLKLAVGWPATDRAWAKRLALVSAAGIAASFLNPYGPKLFVHAFRLIRLVQGFVGEWHSPNFHSPGPIIFLALLVLTIAVLAFNPRTPDPTDVALTLAFTALALSAARNLAVAGIVLGLVCARYSPGAFATLPKRTERQQIAEASSSVLSIMGIVFVLLGLTTVLVVGFPRSARPVEILDESYPLGAIKRLDKPGVRLFIHDGWSGLAIYYDCGSVRKVASGCQDARVFVDLRWDFYGAKISQEYGRAHEAAPDWREILDSSCTTDVLLPPKAPLSQVLALDGDWRLIEESKLSVTYQRRTPAAGCNAYPIPS